MITATKSTIPITIRGDLAFGEGFLPGRQVQVLLSVVWQQAAIFLALLQYFRSFLPYRSILSQRIFVQLP